MHETVLIRASQMSSFSLLQNGYVCKTFSEVEAVQKSEAVTTRSSAHRASQDTRIGAPERCVFVERPAKLQTVFVIIATLKICLKLD